MKVLVSRSIVLLCILQLSFLSLPAHSQKQDHGESDNRKTFYGLSLGLTRNNIDLYHTQNGVAHALEEGKHPFYAPGFRIAVIGGIRLGNYFSLRVMPGVSIFGKNWKPDNIAGSTSPSTNYKVESVLGELPVDIKFHPFRIVNPKPQFILSYLVPYLTSGLGYSFDFASQRTNNDAESIQRLNAHDLRYTCGLGLDCHMRYLTVGFEFKASFGLLSPNTSGTDHTNAFYFHSSPTLSIGINIEA